MKLNTSLKQLIGKWKGEIPIENESSSIQLRTYELYHKRIENFDADDIRFMIGQKIGLKYIIPIALHYLKEDILIETIYYEGDLLKVVLLLDNAFWKKNLKLYSEVYQLLLSNKELLDKLDLSFESDRKLKKQCNDFLKILIK